MRMQTIGPAFPGSSHIAMAFNFFKNLIGNADHTETVQEDGATGPRLDNMPGRLFRQEFNNTPGAVLLDVRTPAEFKSGTIARSVNIDYMSPAFKTKVAGLDKSKTYFVFCRSGNRSLQACKTMHKLGFDVRNLMGGIGEW